MPRLPVGTQQRRFSPPRLGRIFGQGPNALVSVFPCVNVAQALVREVHVISNMKNPAATPTPISVTRYRDQKLRVDKLKQKQGSSKKCKETRDKILRITNWRSMKGKNNGKSKPDRNKLAKYLHRFEEGLPQVC